MTTRTPCTCTLLVSVLIWVPITGSRPMSPLMILSRTVGSFFKTMLRIDTNAISSGNKEMNP